MRGVAQAGHLRSVLHGAVPGAAVLVAVHVKYGQHDEDGVVQPVAHVRLVRNGHVADQHQRRVLALNLAGVNAGLDQDDRLTGAVRCLGRESFVAAHDHGGHGAVVRRFTYRYDMHKRAALLEQAHGGHSLGVGAGPVPIGTFAGG